MFSSNVDHTYRQQHSSRSERHRLQLWWNSQYLPSHVQGACGNSSQRQLHCLRHPQGKTDSELEFPCLLAFRAFICCYAIINTTCHRHAIASGESWFVVSKSSNFNRNPFHEGKWFPHEDSALGSSLSSKFAILTCRKLFFARLTTPFDPLKSLCYQRISLITIS